jgi:hypothetical protein
VRLADVSAALQRLPELSALTPASASTAAALLDMEGIGSIHPDSVSWTFALPVVKRWLTSRCSEALEIFKRVEMDRGAWLVFPSHHMTHEYRSFLLSFCLPLTLYLQPPDSGGMLAPADIMEGLYQLGLSDVASECVVDALRRHFESCVVGSGNASLSYTQMLFDIVGREALPPISPTDFARQM